MSRVFQSKKKSLTQTAQQFSARSPAMKLIRIDACDDEWRALVMLDTKTLAQRSDGTIKTASPIVIGIRYHERFLAEAPHPCEIVTVFQPVGVFHPNCARSGAMCLGHPPAGLGLDFILHQVWAGLNYNMRTVNTRPFEVLNRDAAEFVRNNAERFPLSTRGLFE
ncbi:MAG: hypothetical protein GXY83_26135 [Rhodopirellula sp.]|nr:hypothetical protein [Rhodopirellula sp.]